MRQKIRQSREWLKKKRVAYIAARPHHSFRKTKRTRLKKPGLITVRSAVLETFKIIRENKKLFFGLGLVYMAVTYIFVGGIAQSDFVDLKNATVNLFGGSFDSVGTVASLLTSTMSGAFNTNLTQLQQFLAVFIAFMFWLTLVWALRMRFADKQVKIREALYNSGAPIVAYIVLVIIIILQLTPGAIGVFVFATAQGGGFLQGGIEVMLFAVAGALLALLSLYWLAGSLLSLVVVALPGMYPWRALSIASELAVGRRLRIMGHIFALFATLFMLWVILLLPTLLVDSWLRWDWLPLVPIMVQLLGAFTMVYVATYVYKVYRSLL